MSENPIRLLKPLGESPRIVAATRPEAGEGLTLIRVRTVGLCRTDLLVADGTLPVSSDVVLGHEFSGDVVSASGPGALTPGTLVAVDPTFPMEDGTDGFMGMDVDGAISTYVAVPTQRVLDASGLTHRQAAYLEPVAAAMGGYEAARDAGGRGLLLGDNRIATLTGRILEGPGSALGPALEFDRMDHGEFAALSSTPAGMNRYGWILETRLSDDVFAQAARALVPGGRLICKSRHLVQATIPIRAYVLKRLSIDGRTRSGFPEALDWIVSDPARIEDLIGDAYPVGEWGTAFARAMGGEGRKLFLDL